MSGTVTSMRTTFDLLGLEVGATPTSFVLPVVDRLSTPFRFLYGGSGVAASIEAAETVTDRPLMWITTQFLTNAHPGQQVDIAVDVPVEGRATTQAQVTASVDGTLMLSSLCAHTDRPDDGRQVFLSMPDVPSPDRCAPMFEPFALPEDRPPSFFDHLERRVAAGSFDFARREPHTGTLALWTRLVGRPLGSPASLAFIADIVPLGVSLAAGVAPGGTSLDNTLRVVRHDVETDWVLVEIIASSLQRSIGHGQVRLWSQAGDLLAVAEQTCIIRTSHHQRTSAG